MLIDRFLPAFDVSEVHEVEIDAPPEIVYDAIRQADLRDPVIVRLRRIGRRQVGRLGSHQ